MLQNQNQPLGISVTTILPPFFNITIDFNGIGNRYHLSFNQGNFETHYFQVIVARFEATVSRAITWLFLSIDILSQL